MGRSASQTPVMRQYIAAKESHPDAILFFRLGDFYEMFFEDAVVASRALDLTLTSRNKGAVDEVPMCGVPHHAAHGYVARLIEQGHKVAICEQMADPSKVKGIVPREVVRVITPGVVLDPESLDARANNFLVALLPAAGACGLAALDVSTSELRATSVDGPAALLGEAARLEPAEVLLPDGADEAFFRALSAALPRVHVERLGGAAFDPGRGKAALLEALGEDVRSAAEGLHEAAIRAAGATVAYAAGTQPGVPLRLRRLIPYAPADHLVVDETTRAHLELVRTSTGERRGSLLGLLDETVTPMGGRLLRSWLLLPLVDTKAIGRRLDAVEALRDAAGLRERLRALLASVADVERLLGRAAAGAATPRDLGALRDSLAVLPSIGETLASGGEAAAPLGAPVDPCEALHAELDRALVAEPPTTWKEGGLFAPGYDADLDELVSLSRSGREYLSQLETRERERTGIASLKVRFNKVFGYYLEVTKANLRAVPPDYVRKQTLAGAERYTTPELEEYETKVLTAEDRRRELEAELFVALRSRVVEEGGRLTAMASRLAELDAVSALAHVAHRRGYVRPTLDGGDTLAIEGGRHPVVEVLAAESGFVANDVRLEGEGERLLVITGPNMAGKSTVLRQVALITLMAQAGSFVPAAAAHVGVVDRIFTRVGASDNLARGQSTFMVEMKEAAAILRSATRRSLVLLDEIGRGTSTFDGLSIAWAVAEHLHDVVQCKVLFATHYHELTELASLRPHVANYNVAAERSGDDVVFLRTLLPGGSSRSYGIDVARLAGLPESVLARARQILRNLEAEAPAPEGRASTAAASPQLELFAAAPRVSEVEDLVAGLEIDRMTPIEALSFLVQLQQMARRAREG